MRSRSRGFTLIELMVAIAVLAVMAALAIPSFMDFRKRAALRGAADQIVSVWGDARFEALRRNTQLNVSLRTDSAGAFCIGVATVSDSDCDCFSPGTCDVNSYPADQSEWRGVTAVGNPTLGPTDTDSVGVALIDHKRGGLVNRTDAGGIALKSPLGGSDYRLNIAVDGNGRAVICQPNTGTAQVPQYSNKSC